MHWKPALAMMGACAFFGSLAVAQKKDLSDGDKKFLEQAADEDMTEAHLGQMAEKSASASPVRDFGQKLERDHTDGYQGLTALAGKSGASIPKGIDIRKDRSLEGLAHLKGNNFDRQFLDREVRDHKRALAEFKREAAHGRDADVKAYAGKMVPILEDDLRMAESLAKTHHG